tara:strand:- start:87 stop:413 length:327 start_codon:yes stop_codon:yes gene_type:complete
MGFFSWHTQDDDKPIWNVHTGLNQKVYLIDNKGNHWVENKYDGYGVFGGKDFYELVAEMNDLPSCRDEGISLVFDKTRSHISPNFVTDLSVAWQDEKPKDHDGQGYWK